MPSHPESKMMDRINFIAQFMISRKYMAIIQILFIRNLFLINVKFFVITKVQLFPLQKAVKVLYLNSLVVISYWNTVRRNIRNDYIRYYMIEFCV